MKHQLACGRPKLVLVVDGVFRLDALVKGKEREPNPLKPNGGFVFL